MIAYALALWILGLLIAAIVGTIYAFLVALRAIRLATVETGEFRHFLYWLGFNLCEPLINTILIALMLYSMSSQALQPFWFAMDFQHRLLILIAPLGVLLFPIVSLFTTDSSWRGENAAILLFGLLRGVLACLTLWLIPLSPFSLLPATIGTYVLWKSAIWGNQQVGSPV